MKDLKGIMEYVKNNKKFMVECIVDFGIELTGSEKQVKWAVDILNKKLSNYTTKMVLWEENYYGKDKPENSFDIDGQYAIAIMREMGKSPLQLLESIVNYFLNKFGYSAKSWIDNRNFSINFMDLVKDIYMESNENK